MLHISDLRNNNIDVLSMRANRADTKVPKTFGGFDFDRIQGNDAEVLRRLPVLENLHARKNIAFIGPGGRHRKDAPRAAYGRECCLLGYKTHYIKATELRDRMRKAAASQNPSRCFCQRSVKMFINQPYNPQN